jgi:uncharacterized membrane protein YvbJ
MQVYDKNGHFITREQREAIKQNNSDKKHVIIAGLVFIAILVLCAIFNVQVYL